MFWGRVIGKALPSNHNNSKGMGESALVEIKLVEDGEPLDVEAKEWECAWLGRGLHVPVAEDGAQMSKDKRFALATLLPHQRDDGRGSGAAARRGGVPG